MSIDKKTPALLPVGTHAVNGDFTMAAVIQKWAIGRPVAVRRLSAVIKTAVTVTATVITFKKYPVFDNTGSPVTLGTLTLPTATGLAGKHFFKDIAAVLVKPGEMIVAEVTTTSTAGAGCCQLECEDSPEDSRNNTNMVASA